MDPLAVLEVHLSSQEGWWSRNLGAVVLAGAALLAAIVTVLDRRRALANDRYLKRLEHIRDRIDSALAAMTKAQNVAGNFLVSVQHFETFRTEQRRLADKAGTEAEYTKLKDREAEVQDRLGAEQEVIRPILQDLAVVGAKLFVRLGPEHEIYLKYEASREAAFALFLALSGGVLDNRSLDSRNQDDVLNEARHETNRDFREACRAWFISESAEESWLARQTRKISSRRETSVRESESRALSR